MGPIGNFMMLRIPERFILRMTLLLLLPVTGTVANAATVLIQTPLGDIELEMLTEAAPGTVANFLSYVNDGSYQDSFIHRSVPGFVIQGGGFFFRDGSASAIPTDPPITNEFSVSNTRGTVAMAKLSGDPDSATSQWFINLADNSENLDDQNGGFTVFARVTGNGMAVADAIAALQRFNEGGPFAEIPLIDRDPGEVVTAENLVLTSLSVDSDEDGVYDPDDAFPQDPQETLDTDGDGTGNNADTDDDGDGLPDLIEEELSLDPLDPTDAAGDLDGDGFDNLTEYEDGTDPANPNSNMRTNILVIKLITGGSDFEEQEQN
jgi:cyclophilin family peptidyl-prolyl cis-trans isomerase